MEEMSFTERLIRGAKSLTMAQEKPNKKYLEVLQLLIEDRKKVHNLSKEEIEVLKMELQTATQLMK
ncbi:MAG: hypothetical protein RR306_02270 [Clostridia bacterium]